MVGSREDGETVMFASANVTGLDKLEEEYVDCPGFIIKVGTEVELAGVHCGVETNDAVEAAVHILAGTKVTDKLDGLEDDTSEAPTAEAEEPWLGDGGVVGRTEGVRQLWS